MNRDLQEILHAGKFNAIVYILTSNHGIYKIRLISEYGAHPECVSGNVEYNIKIDWGKITEQAENDAREQLPDNIACAFKYKPRVEWVLPYLGAEYARAGIRCEYTDGTLVRWFERFPEIRHRTRTGRPILPDQLANTSALFAEVMKHHLTPHIDEILTQRAVTELLPQPIAEEIIPHLTMSIRTILLRDVY